MLLNISLPFNRGKSLPEFGDQPASLEVMHWEAEVLGGPGRRGGKAGTGRLWTSWLVDTVCRMPLKLSA